MFTYVFEYFTYLLGFRLKFLLCRYLTWLYWRKIDGFIFCQEIWLFHWNL